MTCSDNACGTGLGSTTLPGDPDNNSIVTATPAFGGVDVTWTLPSTNAHGVAYVRVYRALTNNPNAALIIANASGDRHFDRFNWLGGNIPVQYYWIQFVSVNGTIGEMIGPASAVPQQTIDQIILGLTAQIDYGMLSVELKSEVDKINLNKSLVDSLFTDVEAEQLSIRDVLMNLQSTVDETQVFLTTEIAARQNGVSALVASLNTLAASNQTLQAAIQTEQQARVDADTALTSSITSAQSALDTSIATVETTLSTNITSVNNKANALGALYTAKVSVTDEGTKLIGGFGIYNDGTEVEAGFDVTRFWIGSTKDNKRKPFIVEGSTVYIDEAAINKLTFDKLRAADGSLIVQDGLIKGDYLSIKKIDISGATNFNVKSAATGARMEMTGKVIKIFDGTNTFPRVQIGDLS